MSKAAATTTIKFRRKVGAVSSTIVSPKGDLVQFYQGEPSNPGKIYQDFTEFTPSLFLVASLSSGSGSVKFSKSVDIYVNNTKIEFDDATRLSTNVLGDGQTGHFKREKNTGTDVIYDGMSIVKNLVTAYGGEQVVVRMTGTMTNSGQTESITASYNIPVQEKTGAGYYVSIAAADSNNFIITDKNPENEGGKCKVKVNVYNLESGSEITEGLKYQWQKELVEGWSNISTNRQIEVTADDIDAMANIRVIVYDASTNAEIGMDIQTVRDHTDNFAIDLGANPTDETIVEGSGGKVTYTPRLLSNNTALSGFLFCFSVMDSAGNPLNRVAPSDDPDLILATTPVASFDVTENMCVQANGDVAMTIFAVESAS
jgi:hypothetical protein